MNFDVLGRPIVKPVYSVEEVRVEKKPLPTPAPRNKMLTTSVEKIPLNEEGQYDANNKRVINIAPAIEKTDAIDLGTLQSNIKTSHREIQSLEKKVSDKIESIVKFDRNGNYDMMNKKIQNVGEPINDTDAVILRNLHDAEKSLLQSIEKIPRGPPGHGYKATSDGNYDLMQKRLTNMAHPIDDMDAVMLWVMNFYMDAVRSKAQREIDDVSSKLQQSVSDMSRMFYESVENVKKSIDSIEKKRKELEKLLDRQSDEKDLIKRNPEFHYLHRV
uniref:Uncharacterized protein n=1 Tax=Trichogramma kaykai TaxID=54128 RepID=A0ABD2W114_9HYME